MVALLAPRRKCMFLILVAVAAVFCCHLGHAQINPMQVASSAVLCFNNKLIYRGCNKEYQLNESGDLHIPCKATNEYCNGPCLSETKTLLNCIDNLASKFLFLNRATTQIIGNVLDTGCNSYTNQRDTFIVGNDFNGARESCGLNLYSSAPSIRFQYYVMALVLVACCLLLLQHL